jgi:ATP-dependent Zn protease
VPEKDDYSVSKSQLMARLDVAMGGRVAEELCKIFIFIQISQSLIA